MPESLESQEATTMGLAEESQNERIQQLLAQNAHIAEALYALTKLADAAKPSGAPPSYDDLVQVAKTQVNSLDPGNFVF